MQGVADMDSTSSEEASALLPKQAPKLHSSQRKLEGEGGVGGGEVGAGEGMGSRPPPAPPPAPPPGGAVPRASSSCNLLPIKSKKR